MRYRTIMFKKWLCIPEYAKYGNGATAIRLIDKEDGSPVATATVNIVKESYHPNDHGKIIFSEDLPENQVYIKTWSENEGMVPRLMEAGIIKPLGSLIDVNGHGSMAELVEILK